MGEGTESRRGPLSLKAVEFPCREQARGAERPPDSPTLLGFRLAGQQSLSEIFLLLKGGKKKHKQNTRKPKSGLVQALERLWHWPLENPLALQVGICVVAPEALGVLAHVAAFGAGFG